MFSNSPGRTTLAEHHIETGDAYPVKLPQYRVPHAYRDMQPGKGVERDGKREAN